MKPQLHCFGKAFALKYPNTYLFLSLSICFVSYYNCEVLFYMTGVASYSPKVTFEWMNFCKLPECRLSHQTFET